MASSFSTNAKKVTPANPATPTKPVQEKSTDANKSQQKKKDSSKSNYNAQGYRKIPAYILNEIKSENNSINFCALLPVYLTANVGSTLTKQHLVDIRIEGYSGKPKGTIFLDILLDLMIEIHHLNKAGKDSSDLTNLITLMPIKALSGNIDGFTSTPNNELKDINIDTLNTHLGLDSTKESPTHDVADESLDALVSNLSVGGATKSKSNPFDTKGNLRGVLNITTHTSDDKTHKLGAAFINFAVGKETSANHAIQFLYKCFMLGLEARETNPELSWTTVTDCFTLSLGDPILLPEQIKLSRKSILAT